MQEQKEAGDENGMPVAHGVPKQGLDAKIVRRLEQPFAREAVKWVVKATSQSTTRRGSVESGLVLPYVDVRQYADRLNAVIGIGLWTRRYWVQVVEGLERRIRVGTECRTARMAKLVVTCEVTLAGVGSQTGLGEEWADDDNAATAAEAQAFKRACSMFGVGRYLYEIEGEWVPLDQHRRPVETPALPDWAVPAEQRVLAKPLGGAGLRNRDTVYRQEMIGEVKRRCEWVGAGLAASILTHTFKVTDPEKIRELTLVPQVIDRLENAARGVRRLSELAKAAGEQRYAAICGRLGIGTELDAIPDTATLRRLIEALEGNSGRPTIPQLRNTLVQEARRIAENAKTSVADLVAEASSGALSIGSLHKTGEPDRAVLEGAIRALRAMTA